MLIYILLTILSSGNIYAQDSFFKGKIVNNETSLPISNCSLIIYKNNTVIYHTFSDSSGNFNIKASIFKQGTLIKIHSLTHEDLQIKNTELTKFINNNQFDLGLFRLTSKSILIKEVIIKSSNRYRDTAIIDLSKKNFDRSVMIDELFSNDYGFYKDDKGQLYYNGKRVSDLTVNGKDFFGKNNTDIYNLLPALALQSIQIIETNIDSVYNTTTLTPTIKVNLKLKEKYNKAGFGNISSGYGTLNRYLVSSNGYYYKNNEQVSLSLNTNNINIGDNSPIEPIISFSANSNNTVARSTLLTYNNFIGKKIELRFSIKDKTNTNSFTSQTERRDQVINILSGITNKSNSKTSGIPDSKLSLNYTFDTLNVINLNQSYTYNKLSEIDSLNYKVKSDTSNTISNLGKTQTKRNNSLLTTLAFVHKFSSKKGRSIDITASHASNTINSGETDDIFNLTNTIIEAYYVKNSKNTNENIWSVKANFAEPLSNSSYIDFFSTYKYDKISYANTIASDSLNTLPDLKFDIADQFIQLGARFQKTFKKISLESTVTELADLKRNKTYDQITYKNFFNLNLDLKIDYRPSEKKYLAVYYKKTTTYPEMSQLTDINNSFDLLYQTNGNPNLKPQTNNTIRVDYKFSSLHDYTLNAELNQYSSKYGLNVTAIPNKIQNAFVDNIGNATNASVGLIMPLNVGGKFFINYNTNIAYQEQPTIINNDLNRNNGIAFTQLLSTNKEIFKNVLSISPTLAIIYSKYYYQSSSSNIITLTYSDKFSLSIAKFTVDFFPLVNYNHNISSRTTFSMNGAIKRNLFKKYGMIWIQGYDLFNSFNYQNNFYSPSYVTSIHYSNTKRYFIIGFNYKFNNIN
ncbi:outer membrane receptor protein involved in Fe transport [Mucilaginibacter oryzae]|uniref:Outer membrane receptor protein involved in Fe transport n=1 Tax=Mucilaginibacter oryzae TaxID=468058 RepID=A0A316HBZ5_9SPHI|nr:outer membrane receptor protein involved in Fe transport [Mucilaginibacter oryzae]